MKRAFYLDENFPVEVASHLRQHGHIATTAIEESRQGVSDPFQLLYAAERGWALVTHNRDDFRMLHEAWLLWSRRWGVQERHAGILVLRVPARRAVSDIVDALKTLADDSDSSFDGMLYVWHAATGWVRFRG
jgi:hypothetical protein